MRHSLNRWAARPTHQIAIWTLEMSCGSFLNLRDGALERGHWEVLTLEASSDKLLAAKAVTRRDFERALRERLRPLQEKGTV